MRERQDDEVARKGQGGEVARQDQVDGPVHTQEQEEEGEIVRRQESWKIRDQRKKYYQQNAKRRHQ